MSHIIISLNHSEQVPADTIKAFYQMNALHNVISTTLNYMVARLNGLNNCNSLNCNSLDNSSEKPLTFPYFSHLTQSDFDKEIELDIYLTDSAEGRQLNHDARNKDYATNILSYPSDLPQEVISLLPSIPLGELVICHEVVEKQATEQDKSVRDHLTHLLVHGTLHLLGFDHELGEAERLEMEGFEIDILNKLEINNPY